MVLNKSINQPGYIMKQTAIVNRSIIGRAIVYFNVDEYIVKYWRQGQYQRGSDQYFESKDSAIDGARDKLELWNNIEAFN